MDVTRFLIAQRISMAILETPAGATGAETLVREGKVDYATLGRPFLANPHWP